MIFILFRMKNSIYMDTPEKMNVEFAYVDGKIMAYNNEISRTVPYV